MDLKAWTEAQRAVIGSLMIDPDFCSGEVFQRAKPQHFGDTALRHIFEAAQELWIGARPIDPVTVSAAAGGGEYVQILADCMKMTPTASNVSAWLDICQSCARVAAMQAEALAIINAENEDQAADAYERMGAALQDREDGEDLSLTELVGEYIDRMYDKKPTDYLSWGIDSLDSALWVSPGQFVVIAADSSVGKTALALQFAYHMASKGKRVGFFSLETPRDSLADRLMAEKQVAAIPLPRTKKKALTEDDLLRAGKAGMMSDGIPLRFLRNYNSLERIRAKTVQRRFDVIFIDYVQLIEAAGQERWTIVTNISMGLHRMAQQLGVTVIGLSQITPAVKGQKAPTKDDLRESRQLKQDADAILLLYPDTAEDADQNARVLEIAKNKDGRLARMRLTFEPEHMSFSHLLTMNDMRGVGRAIKGKKSPRIADPAQGKIEELPDDEYIPF